MTQLLHDLIMSSAERRPEAEALRDAARFLTYGALAQDVATLAAGFQASGLCRFDRVAIYLPKSAENVTAMFAAAAAGGVFVPVNPSLKAAQVAHILSDSAACILVTSAGRLAAIAEVLQPLDDLILVVTVDTPPADLRLRVPVVALPEIRARGQALVRPATIDEDMVSIFYTSGSTGRPKGVVLTHRNMVTGAISVSDYLGNTADDSILSVLPFSFDYGFSQLSTAFRVGARVVLLNYLVPGDVVRSAARERITGLAGVPPLWIQLAALDWPEEVRSTLRYITNSGGKMPEATLRTLRQKSPATRVFLMYGLTEAFRSTFLPPELADSRPTSIGKAIPHAEVLVVRPDGTECAPNEAGELVHRGPLVAKGYWRDEEQTRQRFRPMPERFPGLPLPEIAVWSGDLVTRDEEGFLYFVARNDEMIKTSGYRVSPTEVEEALYSTQLVVGAVAFGVTNEQLGQSIAVVVEPVPGSVGHTPNLLEAVRRQVPPFMVPAVVEWQADLPRNPNGKLDRSGIIGRFRPLIEAAGRAS
ncbi:MAG: acyl-CoA ligase (AMP-forming), exosortase A system-associated [Gammaproteobacteria bacterium]|nr:acyl-CoA ligase (AMP-forming), exosortase A system-associated [Gammaproteobacteria bacterium]